MWIIPALRWRPPATLVDSVRLRAGRRALLESSPADTGNRSLKCEQNKFFCQFRKKYCIKMDYFINGWTNCTQKDDKIKLFSKYLGKNTSTWMQKNHISNYLKVTAHSKFLAKKHMKSIYFTAQLHCEIISSQIDFMIQINCRRSFLIGYDSAPICDGHWHNFPGRMHFMTPTKPLRRKEQMTADALTHWATKHRPSKKLKIIKM